METGPAGFLAPITPLSCWRLLKLSAITAHEIGRCTAAETRRKFGRGQALAPEGPRNAAEPPAGRHRAEAPSDSGVRDRRGAKRTGHNRRHDIGFQATRTLQRWSGRLLRSLGVKVNAQGSLPDPGVLLVANHRSYIDIAAIASTIACSFLSKSEVARWPLIGYGARKYANLVFVERENPLSRRRSRLSVAKILTQGTTVVVFPEGTTSAGPGLLPFKPGIFRMAAAQGFRVVPAAIDYADPKAAWIGRDSFVSHFLRTFSCQSLQATVTFGPVLWSRDTEALRQQAWNWIYDALRRSESREEMPGTTLLQKTGEAP